VISKSYLPLHVPSHSFCLPHQELAETFSITKALVSATAVTTAEQSRQIPGKFVVMNLDVILNIKLN
jgi:hypothetical protein